MSETLFFLIYYLFYFSVLPYCAKIHTIGVFSANIQSERVKLTWINYINKKTRMFNCRLFVFVAYHSFTVNRQSKHPRWSI